MSDLKAPRFLKLRLFLSWLLRRDFTITGASDPRWEKDPNSVLNGVNSFVPVRPSGACGGGRPQYAKWRCCDCTWSGVSNRRYACVGHYGVCGY